MFTRDRIDNGASQCITHETDSVLSDRTTSPTSQRLPMSVAKVTEITSTSTVSFEDAIKLGIARASQTLRNVKGAWVSGMKIDCEDGKITDYRVDLKVTFVLND